MAAKKRHKRNGKTTFRVQPLRLNGEDQG